MAAQDGVGTNAPIAVYERRLPVAIERVWENVLDWQHLPWLHRDSFCGVELEESGPWGWRARVALPPREQPSRLTIEVRIDRAAGEYHTRTLAGSGAGTDIVTRLATPDAEHTDVSVSFHVPGLPESARKPLGEGYVRLYTQLWDEDEAMMMRRDALLAGRTPAAARPGARAPLALGAEAALRRRLPLCVELAGDTFRIVEHEGDLLAHSLVCPHLGGPLDQAALERGAVVCPWHGYRYDCETGRGPTGQRYHMAVTARVVVDDGGNAQLVVA